MATSNARGLRLLPLFLACLWAVAAPTSAQVSGKVLDAATRQGVPFANVALVDSAGNVWAQVTTDSTGYFSVIPMTNDALLDVQVIAMGYASVPVEPIRYDGAPVHRIIGIVAQPMELEGLNVEVEGQDLRLLLFGYYDRMERGYGHFIDEEQIRASPVPGVTGALRGTPGMWIRANRQVLLPRMLGGGAPSGITGTAGGLGQQSTRGFDPEDGYCRPNVFLNGSPDFRLNDANANDFNLLAGRSFNDFLPDKDEIIGIEVYNSVASLPREMQIDLERIMDVPATMRDSPGGSGRGCGAILIWTRLDELGTPPDARPPVQDSVG